MEFSASVARGRFASKRGRIYTIGQSEVRALPLGFAGLLTHKIIRIPTKKPLALSGGSSRRRPGERGTPLA